MIATLMVARDIATLMVSPHDGIISRMNTDVYLCLSCLCGDVHLHQQTE